MNNFNELLNSGIKTYRYTNKIINGQREVVRDEILNLTRNTSYEPFFYFEDTKKAILVKEAITNGNSLNGLI